jgi:hypothetical protein
LQGFDPGSGLVQRFGTKPAALCEFIKGVMEKEKGDFGSKEPSRFIVFSQWHSMLQLVARTLVDNGIKVRKCDWYPLSFAYGCRAFSSATLVLKGSWNLILLSYRAGKRTLCLYVHRGLLQWVRVWK